MAVSVSGRGLGLGQGPSLSLEQGQGPTLSLGQGNREEYGQGQGKGVLTPHSNPYLLSHGEDDSLSIIQVLSKVLTQLIEVNCKSNTRQHFVTKFQSSYAPSISIQGYLERINKYAKCSPNCFIVALIYIDRLIEIRNIVLTSLNVHRILITSVLLATKVFDDEFYKNAYYAKLGGVSTSEMNALELEFLSLVNFKLFVSTEIFTKYQEELQCFMTVSISSSEGCCTLTPERSLGNKSESKPPIVVPEVDNRGILSGPNTISPLRPNDVNIAVPRCLLFNPIVQLSCTISPSITDISSSSTSTSSLFNPEDCIYYPPNHSTPWLSSTSSLSSSTSLPSISSSFSYDSPRSLVSYPSSDPSPTLSSASSHIHSQQSIFSLTCQKQDSNHHQETLPSESHLLLHPSNGGVGGATNDMDGIYEYPRPRTTMDGYNYPDNKYPLSHPILQPYPVRTNPYGAISSQSQVESSLQSQCFSSKHSNISIPSNLAISQQKCCSRQRTSTCHQSTSAVVHSQLSQQYNTRMYPNYQPRHYQNPSEIQRPLSQHFEMSGNGYNRSSQQPLSFHASNYTPNGCGFSSQNSFCPSNVNPHHLSGNHVQFSGIPYHQQNQFAGGYYYQPVPTPLVPGPRFLGSSSTPNSVTDIFGPPHLENFQSRPNQAYHEEMGRHHFPIGHPNYSASNLYPIGLCAQPQYYSWSDQDLIAPSNGPTPLFQSFPDMQACTSNSHLNAYPSSTLFYPMALRT